MGPGPYDFAGGLMLETRLGELHGWKSLRLCDPERHCQRQTQEMMGQNTILFFLICKSGLAIMFLIFFDVLFVLLCDNSDVKGIESRLLAI